MLAPVPLFSLAREGHEEVCVFGEVAFLGRDRTLSSSEGRSRFPARSLLKPFQFLATGWAASGRVAPERAYALGSISGSAGQLAEIDLHAGSSGLAAHLDLPLALPLGSDSRALWLANGGGPAQRCHPCYSKHLAILAACRAQGWPLERYTSQDHPFHARLLEVLAPLLERPISELAFVTDGCRLPTPLLEAAELARIYLALAGAPPGSELGAVRTAMLEHPERIGGPERFDTRLMRANPGQLVAKEGADGLLALGITPSARDPEGAALVIKLAGGHQPEWAALAATPFLEALGLTPVSDPTPGQDVTWHVQPGRGPRTPIDISPLLSERIAVWPGDTAFRRRAVAEPNSGSSGSSNSGPGWDLLVSSIETTLHVGAHADAPNHFTIGGAGIDRVPLAPYRGPCEVVAVDVAPGGTIQPRHLGRAPAAPRVLFKTGSFPNAERFDADFVAFSPELVAWLIGLGVLLIGIDTPSIDPFSSKQLPSHHMTRSGRGVAILEGLELAAVEPGCYELVALPLRLEGADASPVRATLWPLR
jgi:arylformamidase